VPRSVTELQAINSEMAAFVTECDDRDAREACAASAQVARLEQIQVVVTPAVTPRGRVVDSETPLRGHVSSHIELYSTVWGNPSLPGV